MRYVVSLIVAVVGLLSIPIQHARAATRATVATVRAHGAAVFDVPSVRIAAGALMVLAVDQVLTTLGYAPGTALPLLAMGPTTYADIASNAAAEVSETFKRVYLEAVDAIPDSTPLTAQLNRTRKFKGAPDALYFNVKMETGGPVANVGDGLALPRPGRPKNKTGKSSLVHTYTVVAVGGQSIPLTNNTRNAFVSNLENQLEDGMQRVQNDIERQYNGDGRGILAVLLTVAGAPTYTLEKPYGKTGAGPGTMLLIEDMDVAHINSGTGAERGRAKVVTVNPDTDQYILSAAIAGSAIGDYVVLCNDVTATGADAVNNYNNEAAGILAACGDTGVFENIDRALYRRWRASVVASSGNMTERKAAGLDSRILTKSGKRPSIYYTTEGIKLDLAESLAARRQTTGESMTLKGGYEAVNLNGRAVLTGPWAPKGHFFALNTDKDSVGMVDVVKMGYVDLDGAKLHRIEGRHAYRADLYFAHQALWTSCNRHGVITGLSDDNTLVR